MGEENELPKIKELYGKLRNDAREVAKDLVMARLVYHAVGIVGLVFGAVSLAMGVSSLVLKLVVFETLPFFDWSLPSMIIAIVIGLVLVILGGTLEEKGEKLEKKYGKTSELKKLTQG